LIILRSKLLFVLLPPPQRSRCVRYCIENELFPQNASNAVSKGVNGASRTLGIPNLSVMVSQREI